MQIKRYDDWLQEYLYYTSGHEIPALYNKWVGIGVIASCLKQNVYLDMRKSFRIYPNMFIIIVDVAGSGKSHAIENCGLNLLEHSDALEPNTENRIYIYDQRISAAAMIKSMAKLYKDTGEHCIAVFAEELGFFTNLSGENSNISHVLVKTYDNHKLANETIARSFEGTPNAQFNIIGGTTPKALKKSVAKEFIDDGVVSRLMFIHSEDIGEAKPFPTPPKNNDTRKTYLAYDLNDFKKLRGGFKWTKEANDYYEEWYVQTRKSYSVRDDKVLFKRLSGKMLKIAMVLSVARKHNLILELSDIIDAIAIRNEALDSYLYIDNKLTTTEFGEKVQSILEIIKANKKIKHSDLQHKVTHWIGTVELHNVILTLIEADLVEEEKVYSKNAKKPTKIYAWKG